MATADLPEGPAPLDWPDRPAAFRQSWLAYHRAVRALAAQVTALLADALGLPQTYFALRTEGGSDLLKVINHPARPMPRSARDLRAGAHTDRGMLTLAAAEDLPGGLQLRTRDGTWIDVPHVPGAFVANVGDLLAYWTNHRWISSEHRYADPPGARRPSVVFFHNPNPGAIVEPLARRAHTAPRPVNVGEWLGPLADDAGLT